MHPPAAAWCSRPAECTAPWTAPAGVPATAAGPPLQGSLPRPWCTALCQLAAPVGMHPLLPRPQAPPIAPVSTRVDLVWPSSYTGQGQLEECQLGLWGSLATLGQVSLA